MLIKQVCTGEDFHKELVKKKIRTKRKIMK